MVRVRLLPPEAGPPAVPARFLKLHATNLALQLHNHSRVFRAVHGSAPFHFPPTNQAGPLPAMAEAARPRWPALLQLGLVLAVLLAAPAAEAWTGEIRGNVVCDVCGDAAIGPEDHALEGQFHTPASSHLVRV
jgi:hypothetical protein